MKILLIQYRTAEGVSYYPALHWHESDDYQPDPQEVADHYTRNGWDVVSFRVVDDGRTRAQEEADYNRDHRTEWRRQALKMMGEEV